MTARTDALLTLAVLAAFSPLSLRAQTAPAPLPPPNTIATPATPAPATPAAPEETKPFVGAITADKVYVRSGPGNNYYELGQLSKGDLVQITESRLGWYKILPPNGTFCLIAKDFVQPSPDGKTGTLKPDKDFVNIRAGSAINHGSSAVLAVIRKNTPFTIVGTSDTYYEIAPPDNVRVYISPQFVSKAPEGTAYKIPDLKLPSGITAPAQNTVTTTTTLPAVAIEPAPNNTTPPPANNTAPENPETVVIRPPVTPENTTPATQPTIPPVPPQPAVTFNATAATEFSDLTKRYQAELQKPPLQRDYEPLLKGYKDLLNEKDLAPSVKAGSESHLAALEKLAAIQRLQKENTTSQDTLAQQRQALQQEYAAAAKAIEDYEKTGPYLAEGTLQSSTAVPGKYALVNPNTGRVNAYVDPAADVDIGSLVGKYIGVRGNTDTAPGTQVTVIHVKNATLLPAPEPATPTPAPR